MRKLTVVSSLVCLAFAASANATVTHTLEANACYIWQGSAAMSWGFFNNNSTTTETGMDCLVIKEGSSIASAWVWVKDQNPSTDVRCTLNHIVPSGGSIYYVNSPQTVQTSGYSSSYQLLAFGAQANTSTYGYYHLTCVIPVSTSNGPSQVGAYSVTEN